MTAVSCYFYVPGSASFSRMVSSFGEPIGSWWRMDQGHWCRLTVTTLCDSARIISKGYPNTTDLASRTRFDFRKRHRHRLGTKRVASRCSDHIAKLPEK